MRFSRFAALAGIVFLAACAGEYPQSSIAPASDFAQRIQDLYFQIFVWTMGILAVVWIVLAYILVRFRERPDSPVPDQIHGHLGLEIAWTIVPALIVVAIAVPTIQATFDTQVPDPDAMVVDVIGHQYWWEFHYPEHGGQRTAGELRLPVDQPVALRIWSDDVLHSFWIPQLGGKRDAYPLRAVPEGDDTKFNWIFMTPSEIGTFMGQCAEFCGQSHAIMGMRVIVESQEDFDAWLADWDAGHAPPDQTAQADVDPQGGPIAEFAALPTLQDDAGAQAPAAASDPQQELIEEGRQAFAAGACVACHAINGDPVAQGVLGPNLTLLGRRATIAAGWLENTPENLERWITDPRSVKPGVLMPGVDYPSDPPSFWPATGLSPDQVRAIVAYLSSLR
jgi:cytochrome c oxidase subunit 2